jgi:KaiC/GvpD/RAD55 family RecA-like ATPase
MNMVTKRDAVRSTTPDGETLPAFQPGSNVLVRGPSLAGKRDIALELLAALPPDERPVVVSAADDAASVRRRLVTTEGTDLSDDCYVVDAVRSQVSGRAVARTDGGDRRTWYAASPNDLTGIGISTTCALSAVYAEGGRPRVVVDSLSTLLQYSSLERLYRFLHVLNSRVRAIDGVTIQVIHADAHSDREVATLAHLFDGVVDVAAETEETDAVDVRTGSTCRSLALSELLSTLAGGRASSTDVPPA